MRRRLLPALLAVLLVLAVAAQVAACGGTASDPYAGTWWEPSSGLRVEIKAAGDGYDVRVGADLDAYPAAVSGGELRVAHPSRGDLFFESAPGGKLRLVSGGTASLLERAPQHQ